MSANERTREALGSRDIRSSFEADVTVALTSVSVAVTRIRVVVYLPEMAAWTKVRAECSSTRSGDARLKRSARSILATIESGSDELTLAIHGSTSLTRLRAGTSTT